MLDAWLDLFLGSRCSVCAAPGRALCVRCRASLPRRAAAAWPSPTPPGLVRPASAGAYAHPLKELVLDHKERGRLALAAPLGALLAVSVMDALRVWSGSPHPDTVDLVPVPSHPSVVRGRGQDPVLRLARSAAVVLRRRGVDARVVRALRVRERPGDQSGLGTAARMANVHGRFEARPLRRRLRAAVLVDDVVTTGATLREAQRALEEAGVLPVGAATVAATRRTNPPRSGAHGAQSQGTGPRLPVSRPGG